MSLIVLMLVSIHYVSMQISYITDIISRRKSENVQVVLIVEWLSVSDWALLPIFKIVGGEREVVLKQLYWHSPIKYSFAQITQMEAI